MNLAKNYTPNKPDHSTYGGNIYNYDFDGYNSVSDIASRIVTDWKFDDKCRKLGENYKRMKLNRKGTK